MKKSQLLLLDTGPIIKLFQIDLWDTFIEKYDITVTRTVEDEAKFAQTDSGIKDINLKSYEEKGLIHIIDADSEIVAKFFKKFDLGYQPIIDDGEKETLAFLENSTDEWLVCSSDAVVYKILGNLNRSEQGISLEELLQQKGIGSNINWKDVSPKDYRNWKYSKQFREKNTRQGQIDSIQNRGLD